MIKMLNQLIEENLKFNYMEWRICLWKICLRIENSWN